MDISDERLSALASVAKVAKDRSGGYSGFNCVLSYLERDVLVDLVPSYPGSILQDHNTFIKDYFDFLKSNNLILFFIKKLLSISITDGDADSKYLAGKILKQMEEDEVMSWIARRPTLYVVNADNGVAVALGIDDRFWTDEW